MRALRWLPIAILLGLTAPASAQQVNAARLAILEAEDRRASTPAELARLRAGVASSDPQTAKVAVRALGRLERPSLVPDILPALASRYPDVRAEAATALAQAASGLRRGATGGPSPAALLQTLRMRLTAEDDAGARAAMAESLARLPYPEEESVALAQETLRELAAAHAAVEDRLGVAKAFEAFVRFQKGALRPPSRDLLALLVGVASPGSAEPLGGPLPAAARSPADPARDARVRRLALEALATAGAADAPVIDHARRDPDAQVRRLAVRAAGQAHILPVVTAALEDASPMVRLEAVRGLSAAAGDQTCAWLLAATTDPDSHVMLQAIDQLGVCGQWDQAVTRLADLASDAAALATARQWHRSSHALVALARAAPPRAALVLPSHASASNPFVRVYAARAAHAMKERGVLERLAADASDNVAEAAIDALVDVAGSDAATSFVAALARPGYQAIRAAARALAAGPSTPEVVRALRACHARLVTQAYANSTDARAAIEATLGALGSPLTEEARSSAPPPRTIAPTLEELRRLAAPRARLTIRGLGLIDVALITLEAPLTVVHFARLAESGYYNGLTIHRVAPNFVLQGGSPDANEYVGHRDHMRDEVGQWPHVRGALGISTRGRDTGDAQFFVSLVDNPRLDHEYTVFGQVLAGMDVADQVLEGDVVESVQILSR